MKVLQTSTGSHLGSPGGDSTQVTPDLAASSPDLAASSPDLAPLSLDLPDELIHEILFRLPPDEPAHLVRLSILSKSWDRLLSDPAFHHQYHKLHQTTPTLGFLYSEYSTEIVTSFIPATGFCPPSIPNYKLTDFAVRDCRHGHVLGRAFHFGFVHMQLVVWNPVTGHHTHLKSFDHSLICMGEAVLCPVDGCDHATCHDFHVVCVGINKEEGTTTAYVYSSQTDEWSAPTPGLQLDGCNIQTHNVLVGGAIYFLLTYGPHGTQILKYDIGRHQISIIESPEAAAMFDQGTILMAPKDGVLGIAHLKTLSVYLWTMKAGPDGAVAWTQDKIIDLAALLPVGDPVSKIRLIGSVEGTNIIFASTSLRIYSIDLKLLKSKKLREQQNRRDIFPFMSFYNPLERRSGTSLSAGYNSSSASLGEVLA